MTKKRILSAVLAGVMTLSAFTALASCSKKEVEPEKSKRTNVYSAEDVTLPDGIEYINQMTVSGDKAYLTYYKQFTVTYNELGEEVERRVGYYYDDGAYDVVMPEVEVAVEEPVEEEVSDDTAEADDTVTDADGDGIADEDTADKEDPAPVVPVEPGSNNQSSSLPEGWWYGYEGVDMMAVVDLVTKEMTEIEIDIPDEYGYTNNSLIDADGNFVAVTQNWTYNEDYSESTVNYYYIRVSTESGEVIDAKSINDVLTGIGLDLQMVYINRCAADTNGNLYLVLDASIIILDSEFNHKGTVELGTGWVNDIHPIGEKVLVVFNPDASTSRQIYFIENGQAVKLESDVLAEAFKSYPSIVGASENKLYYSTTTGITAYDFTTDTAGEILNYINSDIDTTSGYNLQSFGEDKFICHITDWSSEMRKTTLSILTRVPDEQLQEEIILKLGCTYIDYYVNKAIIEYNKKNTGVRITVVDYSPYNNQENEWTGAVTQLNNDIIIGKMPDMLLLNNELPVDSYFQKGIFADLNQFIDDPEIGLDRTKYLSNIFEATTADGKMNSIIISYNVNTMMAKSKFVGTESGWTFDEMMNCINTLPEGMQAFFGYSRAQIIDLFFNNSMNSFVDWETGETKFETDGFIKFIEYLKTCPEKGYWDEYYGDDYVYDEELEMQMNQNYELRYYNDTALFSFAYLSNLSSYVYALNSFASREVTAVGYPTDDGTSNGAVIVPNIEIAISNSTAAKKQAWEVIKSFMNSEFIKDVTWEFSSNIESLEKMAETALDDYYYYEITDDDLEWYREMNYSDDYIQYMKESNQKLDQEIIDMTLDIVKNVKTVQRNDSALVDIINEELSGFFAGSKTAEETAKVIAGRARIYISENS